MQRKKQKKVNRKATVVNLFGAKVEINGTEWFCLGEVGKAVEGRICLAVKGSEPSPAAVHMIVINHPTASAEDKA